MVAADLQVAGSVPAGIKGGGGAPCGQKRHGQQAGAQRPAIMSEIGAACRSMLCLPSSVRLCVHEPMVRNIRVNLWFVVARSNDQRHLQFNGATEGRRFGRRCALVGSAGGFYGLVSAGQRRADGGA